VVAAAAVVLGAQVVQGIEVVVQNDSLVGDDTGAIVWSFSAGEQAAAWLTSPCDGTIVAVQVLWRSPMASSADAIEENIFIYDGDAGEFPTPGPILQTIQAPMLTDGVLNEYRFLDENQTIPINVPVTAGQEFVVALEFSNEAGPPADPSIVRDTDGSTPGKNTFLLLPGFWLDAQLLGINGDWVIRAVVDCDPVGACCSDVGSCVLETQDDCANQIGGAWQGPETICPDDCVAPCVGDIDGDGDTDVFDFGIFAPNFGATGLPPFTGGDLDGDGDVDVFDFGFFAPDFGCSQ
jgi:hypothetical protein